MHKTLRPRGKGFTLIELLVVISIIALLISILLPSLGQARIAAQKAQGLADVKGITNTMHIYGGDWNSWIPYNNPMGSWDWYQQENKYFESGVETQWYPVASHGLWMNRVIENTVPANQYNYTNQPFNQNIATGIGQLIEAEYLPITMAFSPNTRIDDPSSHWMRRQYFGEPLQFPFVVGDAISASYGGATAINGNWTPYGGGSNYSLQGTYFWRGADHSEPNAAYVPNVTPGSMARHHASERRNAHIDTPGFNEVSKVADRRGFHYDGVRPGGNAGFGDGSGQFINEPRYTAWSTDKRGTTTDPTVLLTPDDVAFAGANQNRNAAAGTYLFFRIDNYKKYGDFDVDNIVP